MSVALTVKTTINEVLDPKTRKYSSTSQTNRVYKGVLADGTKFKYQTKSTGSVGVPQKVDYDLVLGDKTYRNNLGTVPHKQMAEVSALINSIPLR